MENSLVSARVNQGNARVTLSAQLLPATAVTTHRQGDGVVFELFHKKRIKREVSYYPLRKIISGFTLTP